MAEIFDFHVQDDRSILIPQNRHLEPIMQEDHKVATWRFRIPKVLNNIDMSAWSWWFVYVNAKGQEYSELLTLTDDIDEPSNYSTADYDIDYGISKFPGSFSFALEAISAQQGGEISGEWHTRTYAHTVTATLQGNQAEYTEAESDIISALIVEVQNKINSLIGGATPLVVSSVSAMTDTSKIYVLSTDGNWYYHNGTTWVSGGTYASGITIDPTLSQSGQAADAKAVGDKVDAISDYANIEFLDFQSGHIRIWVAVGATVNLTRQTNSAGVKSAIIDVSENDTVVINGATASGYRMYGFVDANNALISVSASSELSGDNLLITAPANASKAIVNLVTGSAFKGLSGYDYFQPLKKTLSDANSAIPNRIYVTTGGTSNVPETAGVLITYRYERNNGTGYAQTFVGSTNNVYNRIKWGANGDTWTGWRKSISDNDANEYMQGVISGNAISDADNAMPNRVYVFTSAVSNTPEDNGTLMTFRYAYSTGTQVGQVQIFVGTSGAMYNRIKWGGSGGTWTAWKKLLTELSTPVYDTYTVGVFEKFAVIGDSFASGEIVVTAGSYVDYYYQSWGQVLARKVGNTCLNLSDGGLNTRTWMTSAKGLSLLNSSDAQNLYIIALGINDNSLGSEYIGTAADIGTSADSFYGNYSKIIDAIRTKAPNAKIILSKTAFNYGNFPAINSAIETIATHYGVPYIDPIADEYMGSSDFNGKMMNGHPTATMYGAMATAYERMIAKCQGDNYDYFKDYTGT